MRATTRRAAAAAVLAMAALAVVAAGAVHGPAEAPVRTAEGRLHAPRTVLVQLTGESNINDRGAVAAAVASARLRVVRCASQRLRLWVVDYAPGTHDSAIAAAAAAAALPAVFAASPDYAANLRSVTPNDTRFPEMWGLYNDGTQRGARAGADVSAPLAWEIATGGPNTRGDQPHVAVVDGDFVIEHNDHASLWVNSVEAAGTLGEDDDGNGYVDDIYGWSGYSDSGNLPISGNRYHGCHCAGTVGADGNNEEGVVGVGWGLPVIRIGGSTGVTSIAITAYEYALDLKTRWLETGGAEGVNVVATSSSFGVDRQSCEVFPFSLWNDMYDMLGEAGILSMGATTNSNTNVDRSGDVPTSCSSEFMISVTNLNNKDKRSIAGYGRETIDVGAPGEDILSIAPQNGYGTLSGTSMATPHVAGVVGVAHSAASSALADLCRSPDTAADCARNIRDMMLDNVDPVANIASNTVTGGRVNLYATVLAASTYPEIPPRLADITLDTSVDTDSGTTLVTVGVFGASNADAVEGADVYVEINGGVATLMQTTDNDGRAAFSFTAGALQPGVHTLCRYKVQALGYLPNVEKECTEFEIVSLSCGGDDVTELFSETGRPVVEGASTAGLENDFFVEGCQAAGSDAGEAKFFWTAPEAGEYEFEALPTTDGFIPVISLYSDCGETRMRCARDRITITLSANQGVFIVVDGYGAGDEGQFDLHIGASCPRFIRDLGDQLGANVASGLNWFSTDTVRASCLSGNQQTGGADEIFRWMAPATGTYAFNTVGSNYNTALSAYNDCRRSDSLQLLSCESSTPNESSDLVLELEQNQVVFLVLDAWRFQLGSYQLNIARIDDARRASMTVVKASCPLVEVAGGLPGAVVHLYGTNAGQGADDTLLGSAVMSSFGRTVVDVDPAVCDKFEGMYADFQ